MAQHFSEELVAKCSTVRTQAGGWGRGVDVANTVVINEIWLEFMNYVMPVQSADQLVSATHGVHTLSDSCLLWVSFDIISAQWTAPAICHCAWPLGNCKGETCGGRPIMGQQHLPCDVSGQKRLKPSAYEQLTYLSIKQIKNKTTTCRSTNFQYCKCDLALLRHQANMKGFVYLAFSCAATPVAPPWGYSKCVRPEEAPTFRCLPDYFAWDITWSYCVFEWYPNECESGWNSRHSRASSNKWHCYNHGQVAVA